MSGGQSQQSSTNRLDPEVKQAFLENYGSAKNTAGNLDARQFAGFNPDQLAGFDITKQTATQQPGRALVNQGAEITSGAGLTPQSISTFLNPYTQNVVDTTLSDIGRQRDIALTENAAKVTAANAFGNTRRGIQEAAVVDPYARAMASEAGKLRSGAYDAATQAAGQAAGIDLSKGSQLGQLGTAAQNLGFQAGEQLQKVGGTQQMFTQEQMDAIRNLPLEQQQIINQALSLNPAGGSGNISTSSGGSKQSVFGWLGL
jgi:hypothetical protein